MTCGGKGDPVVPLCDVRCRRCGHPVIEPGKPATAIIVDQNAGQGMNQLAWCGPECAAFAGWPFLKSERGKPPRNAIGPAV